MIFPLSIDSPHLSQCQDPTIDPAPVHTPAHTAPLLTHLSHFCLFRVSLCYTWNAGRHIRLHIRVHYTLWWSHTDSGGHRGVAHCCWYHHKTLTRRWVWTLSRFIFDFYMTRARHSEHSLCLETRSSFVKTLLKSFLVTTPYCRRKDAR